MSANIVPMFKVQDIAGKMPPHDPGAEAAVLTTCMLKPDTAASLLAIAGTTDFYWASHRAIAEAIVDLLEAGVACDMTSVATRMRETGRMRILGSASFLIDMANQVAAISQPAQYAKTIRDLATVRRLTETLHRLIAESYEPIADVSAFLSRVDAAVSDVTRQRKDQSSIGALDAAKIVARTLSEPPVATITTGFNALDRETMGFEQKCLYILAGRPGMGKTAVAMQMATAAAEAGHTVLVVSMEMPAEQLMRRMVCTRAGVPMEAVRSRMLSPLQWSKFTTAASGLAQLPIQFAAKPGQTLLDVKAQVRTHKPALVIIDHIGLLRAATGSNASKRSREQEVAEFSRGLKAIALEASIPVMALCQVNRDVAKGHRRPGLSDLRESGSIEQDADGVWFVHRPGYYDPKASADVAREAEIIVAKQRDGATPVLPFEWDGSIASFTERI